MLSRESQSSMNSVLGGAETCLVKCWSCSQDVVDRRGVRPEVPVGSESLVMAQPPPFRGLLSFSPLCLSSSSPSNELIQEEGAFWPSEPKACSVPCLLIPRTMSFLKSVIWRVQLQRAVVRLAVDSSICGAHFLGHRKAFRGCLPQLLLRLRSTPPPPTPKPWR